MCCARRLPRGTAAMSSAGSRAAARCLPCVTLGASVPPFGMRMTRWWSWLPNVRSYRPCSPSKRSKSMNSSPDKPLTCGAAAHCVWNKLSRRKRSRPVLSSASISAGVATAIYIASAKPWDGSCATTSCRPSKATCRTRCFRSSPTRPSRRFWACWKHSRRI